MRVTRAGQGRDGDPGRAAAPDSPAVVWGVGLGPALETGREPGKRMEEAEGADGVEKERAKQESRREERRARKGAQDGAGDSRSWRTPRLEPRQIALEGYLLRFSSARRRNS